MFSGTFSAFVMNITAPERTIGAAKTKRRQVVVEIDLRLRAQDRLRDQAGAVFGGNPFAFDDGAVSIKPDDSARGVKAMIDGAGPFVCKIVGAIKAVNKIDPKRDEDAPYIGLRLRTVDPKAHALAQRDDLLSDVEIEPCAIDDFLREAGEQLTLGAARVIAAVATDPGFAAAVQRGLDLDRSTATIRTLKTPPKSAVPVAWVAPTVSVFDSLRKSGALDGIAIPCDSESGEAVAYKIDKLAEIMSVAVSVRVSKVKISKALAEAKMLVWTDKGGNTARVRDAAGKRHRCVVVAL